MQYKSTILDYADKNLKKLRKLVINENSQIPEKILLNELKKYNLKDALKQIGIFHKAMYDFNGIDINLRPFSVKCPSSGVLIRTDILASLVHFFIISGTNDYKNKLISQNDQRKSEANITFLCLISSYLEDSLDDIDNTLCLLLRLHRQQIELQTNIKSDMCRNYCLFNGNFGDIFENETGLSLKDYYLYAFLMIIILLKNKPYFTKKELFEIITDEKFSQNKLEKFIDYLSTDYKEYRSKQILNKNIKIIEKKPIIKTLESTETLYIVPSPPYLLEKVYKGVFFDIETTFSKRSDFTQEFGHVFEKYVGRILNINTSNEKIKAELKYKKNSKQAEFVDWIVDENNEAFLIEVKSATIPLYAIYEDRLDEFIVKNVLEAYSQIIKKIRDIDDYEELEFLKNKKIHPLIIFRKAPFLNLELFKEKINNVLDKYIDKKPDYRMIKEYLETEFLYLFNIEEFEYFWINRNILSIEKLFLDLKESCNQESIISIISKISGTTNRNILFDNISDELFAFEKNLVNEVYPTPNNP